MGKFNIRKEKCIMDSFDMILDNVENKVVFESLLKTREKLNQYNNISCSVSGGQIAT